MKGFRMPEETGEGKEAPAEGGRVRRKVIKAVDGSEEFDWESEDGGGRSSDPETPGSLRPILFGGLAVLILMVGVVISIYYYFGWIREITFHPRPSFEDDEPVHDPWTKLSNIGFLKLILIALTVASIVLGFWQGPFGDAF